MARAQNLLAQAIPAENSGSERAYCAADYGNGKTARSKKNRNGKTKKGTRTGKVQPPAPHVWITLMWHVGLRLPWTWRLGPSNTSQRTHVMQMLGEETFPENTLFCGDAGFVGYELWALILKRKFELLVRVGGNVRLLVERGNVVLTSNMIVLSWPEHAVRSQQKPLRLRLVRVKIGRTKMWLLTSVMDKSKLSLDQIRELYKQRWGIEVELRCRNSDRVAVERHWSLIAMAAAELAALKEQLAGRRIPIPKVTSKRRTTLNPDDPPCRSLAESVRAIRYALSNLHDAPPASETLTARLNRAVVVHSPGDAKSKRARYRPPNADHNKPLGTPKLRLLKDSEMKKLKMLRQDKLSI